MVDPYLTTMTNNMGDNIMDVVGNRSGVISMSTIIVIWCDGMFMGGGGGAVAGGGGVFITAGGDVKRWIM